MKSHYTLCNWGVALDACTFCTAGLHSCSYSNCDHISVLWCCSCERNIQNYVIISLQCVLCLCRVKIWIPKSQVLTFRYFLVLLMPLPPLPRIGGRNWGRENLWAGNRNRDQADIWASKTDRGPLKWRWCLPSSRALKHQRGTNPQCQTGLRVCTWIQPHLRSIASMESRR